MDHFNAQPASAFLLLKFPALMLLVTETPFICNGFCCWIAWSRGISEIKMPSWFCISDHQIDGCSVTKATVANKIFVNAWLSIRFSRHLNENDIEAQN